MSEPLGGIPAAVVEAARRVLEAACARDFWTDRCAPVEMQIAFSRPSYADTLWAGQSFAVRWSGGPASGNVVLRYRFDDSPDVFSGFGIPAEGVPNSGMFTWAIDGGLPTSRGFELLLASENDAGNFAFSDLFSVYGAMDMNGYIWKQGDYGECR